MTTGRTWLGPLHRRPDLQFVLSIVGGVATAAVGLLYLPSAWSATKTCSSSGAGCGDHPFWGFSPMIFLVACILGVIVGALVVVVGVLTVRAAPRGRWAGYLVIGLSGVGVLAYGGFGLGVVAGVLAGLLISEPQSGGTDASSPAEWSGWFPAGVPPAPRGSKRVSAGRPSVTEWDGIVSASRLAPAGTGRAPVTLPTADRLARALERSRIAAPAGSDSRSSPAVVVLPPPPVGLRTSPGAGRAAAPSGARPPASRPSARSDVSAARAAPSSANSRWSLEPADLAPDTDEPDVPTPPRSTAPSRPGSDGEFRLSRSQTARGHYVPGSASRGPLRVPRGTSPSPPPEPDPEPEEVETSEEVPQPSPVPEHEELPPVASPPAPETPVGPPPTLFSLPEVPPPAPAPAPGSEPPKQRMKAWRCSVCKLVNAPWSARCTRCQADPPVAS